MRSIRPPSAKPPKKATNFAIPRAGATVTMSKEAQLSIAERDFILEALREDVRLDGRQPDQFRPMDITFGEEYGHVKLQLGKTRCALPLILCRLLLLIASLALLFASLLRSPSLVRNVLLMVYSTSTWS
jgi:hypothetical protein